MCKPNNRFFGNAIPQSIENSCNCLRVLWTTRKCTCLRLPRSQYFLFEHLGSITLSFPIWVQNNTELMCIILILYFLSELTLRVIELWACFSRLSVSWYLNAVVGCVCEKIWVPWPRKSYRTWPTKDLITSSGILLVRSSLKPHIQVYVWYDKNVGDLHNFCLSTTGTSS